MGVHRVSLQAAQLRVLERFTGTAQVLQPTVHRG